MRIENGDPESVSSFTTSIFSHVKPSNFSSVQCPQVRNSTLAHRSKPYDQKLHPLSRAVLRLNTLKEVDQAIVGQEDRGRDK